MSGGGFHPVKRRQPEATDWEELDGPDGGGVAPVTAHVPAFAEVVVVAGPGPAARAPRPSLVAVMGARGGGGRTTVAALLASTLAAGRPEQVTAVDTVPDFGNLTERLAGRQVPVRVTAGRPPGPGAPAEDAIVVADGPAGVRPEPLPTVLRAAGQLVVLLTPDQGGAHRDLRLLDWLDVNGHDGLVRRAVAVLNERSAGGPAPASLGPLAAHLAQRCRAVVRLPHDPHLAEGGPIDQAALGDAAGRARSELAAAVADALGDPEPSDAAVQELVEEVQLAAMTVPGYLGAGVQAPTGERRAWRVALAFAEPWQLQDWRASPARARCYEEVCRRGGGALATRAVGGTSPT